jgi:alpha/beta superfamily hydrolase
MMQILLIVLIILQIGVLCAVQKPNSKPDLKLDYDLQIPANKEKVPCVIICSGQGYHKDLPLIKEFADLAEKSGFAAVRFNWSYFTAKGKPSADGNAELADLESIINLVKQNAKIDSTRIYIAGKSMGSLLAWNAFQEHKELKGCILLTPLLSKAEEGNSYYPDLAKETRPVVFILGDRDTSMCKLTELYKYLGTCAQNISVVALAGAHGIQIEDEADNPNLKKINQEGIRLAVESAVYRLKVFEYDQKK